MPIFKAAFFLLLALVACSTARDRPDNAVYVMRHLHTPAGERDPDLTDEGRQAAERLSALLGAERIRAIYVTDFARSRQTAAPLAGRLGLTPIVYDPADSAGIAARARAGPRPALIVGHSNTVPDLVEALGGPRPEALVHEDFGDLWRVEPDGATTRVAIGE